MFNKLCRVNFFFKGWEALGTLFSFKLRYLHIAREAKEILVPKSLSYSGSCCLFFSWATVCWNKKEIYGHGKSFIFNHDKHLLYDLPMWSIFPLPQLLEWTWISISTYTSTKQYDTTTVLQCVRIKIGSSISSLFPFLGKLETQT